MSDLSALEASRAISPLLGSVGGRFMLHPDTLGVGAPAGYGNGFELYFAGRGGVLGDVDADVVVSAFGFFNPDLVRTMWTRGIAVEGARAAAARYVDLCTAWGRARLGAVDGLDRCAELLGRVVDGASVVGFPLFAGWRAAPRPDDGAGRAYLLCHVAREWRGSAHVLATRSLGLSPIESILNDPKAGARGAKMFGWTDPLPDVSGAASERAEAEALTDRLLVEGYEQLDPSERAELLDLVTAIGTALDAAG